MITKMGIIEGKAQELMVSRSAQHNERRANVKTYVAFFHIHRLSLPIVLVMKQLASRNIAPHYVLIWFQIFHSNTLKIIAPSQSYSF